MNFAFRRDHAQNALLVRSLHAPRGARSQRRARRQINQIEHVDVIYLQILIAQVIDINPISWSNPINQISPIAWII